ncbi:MAG: phosphonate C-P lyase system protein PhnH [Acetobacteraceae bacterium]|nr:phosphonate C-P lyase system protein PhnH [Acetobacteraceae bacterium]
MIAAGFADPALDAQRCFRAVLEAMSRPGRVQQLPQALLPEPPEPLDPATAAALLTLADADTPVWLDDVAAPAADWLRFHAGCPIVAAPMVATFALACGAVPALDSLAAGTEEAPQESATLVIQLASLAAGTPLRLSGPGIEREHVLHVTGLPPGFAPAWTRNAARFPCGIDLILCAGHALAALPRSVRVVEGAG